jgi:anthranilate/para-aminobenzoate synthase component I
MGTVSVPLKFVSIEIIDDLEPERRGPYVVVQANQFNGDMTHAYNTNHDYQRRRTYLQSGAALFTTAPQTGIY